MSADSPEDDLTRAIVDHLGSCPKPESTMAIALALRVAYPAVLAELESLEELGIVIRDPQSRSTTWWLG